MSILAYQLLDAIFVVLGGLLDAGAGELQPCFLQSCNDRPGLYASGDQQDPLSSKTSLVGCNALPCPRLFACNYCVRSLQELLRSATLNKELANAAQSVAHIRDSVKGAFKIRNAIALLHFAGDINHGFGADHHGGAGPMRAGDLMVFR